jgi:hypothetical protein
VQVGGLRSIKRKEEELRETRTRDVGRAREIPRNDFSYTFFYIATPNTSPGCAHVVLEKQAHHAHPAAAGHTAEYGVQHPAGAIHLVQWWPYEGLVNPAAGPRPQGRHVSNPPCAVVFVQRERSGGVRGEGGGGWMETKVHRRTPPALFTHQCPRHSSKFRCAHSPALTSASSCSVLPWRC